jgi:threonine aldolase
MIPKRLIGFRCNSDYFCWMRIELRSDTFTQSTPAMLDAMFRAKVGDDVFGEDEAMNELELQTARYFGMEAGIFCPSGTMANQIAIKCHTQPGQEVICHKQSHVYIYEGGGIAFHSGCQVRALDGDQGKINAVSISENINNPDIHKPSSALVCLENTTNRGGGACYTVDELEQISALCQSKNLCLHLDGARLWNALVATGQNPSIFGELFQSISVCYSKGMGAPVGSVLLGSTSFIQKARRYRKLMGGGMRQAGYLAAACTYALHNHLEKLKTDHDHAQQIADALLKTDYVKSVMPIQTNIIIFEIGGRYTASSLNDYFKLNGVQCIAISEKQIRMVTHLDVGSEMIDKVIQLINQA